MTQPSKDFLFAISMVTTARKGMTVITVCDILEEEFGKSLTYYGRVDRVRNKDARWDYEGGNRGFVFRNASDAVWFKMRYL